MTHIRLAEKKDVPFIWEVAEKTWPVSYKDVISAGQIRYMLDLMYNTEKLKQQSAIHPRLSGLLKKMGKSSDFAELSIIIPKPGPHAFINYIFFPKRKVPESVKSWLITWQKKP